MSPCLGQIKAKEGKCMVYENKRAVCMPFNHNITFHINNSSGDRYVNIPANPKPYKAVADRRFQSKSKPSNKKHTTY